MTEETKPTDENEPYTEDSCGIPVWGSPVEHEEAMDAFCKVARYWTDHSDIDHVQARAVEPLGTIGEFVEEGLRFLWHFVVMPDRDESGRLVCDQRGENRCEAD